MQIQDIFKFDISSNISKWVITDDVVMGGRSCGEFYLNEKGNGVFKGHVSLENNGGFSSLRYRFPLLDVKPYSKLVLRVKGDGKKYQIRLKTKTLNSHAFVSYFETSNHWEDIHIDLNTLYPAFRGKKLNIPNFNEDTICQVAFLIANKKEEYFKLQIDYIGLMQ